MMSFTDAELDMLTADGYEPGYMMDVREGDLVAIPPVTRSSFGQAEDKTVITVVVTRIMPTRGDYMDEGGDMVRNTVMVFIGTDLDNRPRHLSYGGTYPCLIKREG